MKAEKLKLKLKEIFGNEIEFNKEFDMYAESIKNIGTNLIDWCRLVKDGKIKYAPSIKTKSIIFIKKIGSSNRCIVVKVMNGEFKEVHLADHTYYDKLRKVLGLKKDNRDY